MMRVTYDEACQCAYIYLTGKIKPGEAKRQIVCVPGPDIILDLDADGHLLGIELLDKKYLHPKLLDIAEIIK